MYTYFYADFDGTNLHLLNDWYVNPEKIDPDCYNSFGAWTGGGSERWDIRAYGSGRVEVTKNGQKLDTKLSGVEGGAGFGPSPNDKTPHTIYELRIPAAAGRWGVQLHDPGPSFQCSRRLGDTSAMTGDLAAADAGASSTVQAGGGLAAPAKPVGVQPANGAANVETPVTLGWEATNPPERFVTYVVTVGASSDVTKPSWTGTTTKTSLTLPRGLLAGKTQYFWRVAAVNNAGRVASDALSFTTAVRATPGTNVLALTKTGGGTVTSEPAGISCGELCIGTSANFTQGTSVTLTAVPPQGKAFTGWSGDCITMLLDPTKSTVTMDANRACTATFGTPATTYDLTTNITPAQSGTITVSGAATCSQSSCTNPFAINSTVNLTANPAQGFTFASWSGACSGTKAATSVVLDGNKTCTATFTPTQYTLTVNVNPASAANVSATQPVGQISGCTGAGGTCTGNYAANTTVSLGGQIQGAFAVSGWSGDCAGSTLATSVSMTGANAQKTCTLNLVPLVNLTASKTGTGTGTVVANSAGINCGPACNGQVGQVAQNTQVQLTATPALGSVFSGWTGCTTNAATTINVTVDQAKTCTAGFALTNFTLTVVPTPDLGGGQVNATPDGILSCGTGGGTCSASYPAQQAVSLAATPAAGYRFGGFGGAGCGSNVAMNSDLTCTATFIQQFALNVATNGNSGTGSVSSTNVGGIACNGGSGNCAAQYDAGQVVLLTASAAVGSTFTGWTGCSTSTQPNIQVTMSQLQTCTAGFTLTNYPLNVAISPTGSGAVSSFPGTLTCTSTNCSGAFGANSVVSVTAQAATGFRFANWTGDCTNTTQTSSNVTMTATRACTANFVADVQLTVNKTGSTSTGTVTSSPTGINCGTGCSGQSAGFAPGTDVTLTAAPSAAATFTGWSGCSTSTNPKIVVTVASATTCTAVFAVQPVTFSLSITNTAAGSVQSITPSSPRIQCPAGGLGTCSASYPPSTQLRLLASPSIGFTTATWGGDCTGTNGIDVTFSLTANRVCTVTFQ